MQNKLRKCPFCGKRVAVCETVADIGLMDDDHPDYGWAKNLYAVVCNYTAGGCGAATRGYATVKAATKAWNRRYGDGMDKREG